MFTRLFTLLVAMAQMASTRYIMYLTGSVKLSPSRFRNSAHDATRQHNVVPEKSRVSALTHVALAFMSPAAFNREEPRSPSWPLFTTVEETRLRFAEGTAIMVAVGGWGDTAGFEVAAATEDERKLFARNVKSMVDSTGADGWAVICLNLDRVLMVCFQVLILTGNIPGW